MVATSITRKGQITIPKKIRDNLNLSTNDKILFIQRGAELILKPVKNILSLKGIVKVKDVQDFDAIRK